MSRLYRIKIDVVVSEKSDGIYSGIEDVINRVHVDGDDIVDFSASKVYVMPDEAVHIKKSIILDSIRDLLNRIRPKILKKELLNLIKQMEDMVNEGS